jgi:selenoprotein W-related protein
MTEVTITYCVPCRYQFKAIQDADAILKEFGQRLSGLRLVPGEHGVYDVAVDGHVLFSLERAEHFPETQELLDKIRRNIPAGRKRRVKA